LASAGAIFTPSFGVTRVMILSPSPFPSPVGDCVATHSEPFDELRANGQVL
jgi:hypothetical protein